MHARALNSHLAAGAAACLCWSCATTPPPPPSVGQTEIIGPFTGIDAPLHPDNLEPVEVKYYGTDLGWTYEHKGVLHILFGDTVVDEHATEGGALRDANGVRNDDIFATLDLADWPDPDRITPTNIPRIRLGQDPGTDRLTSIQLGYVMDGLKTPEAGFSNGERQFGLFILSKPRGCRVDEDCGPEFSCDTGMGYVGVPLAQQEGLTLGCVDGRPGCVSDPLIDESGNTVPGSGLCVDLTSSVRDDSAGGRFASVAMYQRVAVRDEANPGDYTGITDWLTNKFINTTMSTVTAFDPERGGGWRQQDYRTPLAPGLTSLNTRSVLMWGRPGFIGVGARDRPMNLYFAYTKMPTAPEFAWSPLYYTGLDSEGKPTFSPHEREAAPVDLNAALPGIQPDEEIDMVQHMSVVWVEPLKKWIMFYGGGIDATPRPEMFLPECGIMQIFIQSDCLEVQARQGSIWMRSADDPWGPWTTPQRVIAGGDPVAGNADQYAPGGVLYHHACQGSDCAPHSPMAVMNPNGYGWFYGANIIEPWIKETPEGVSVIWLASTWDPYRVIMLRTHITR